MELPESTKTESSSGFTPPSGSGTAKLVDFKKNDLLEVTVTRPENDMRWESRKVLDYVNLEKPAKDREIKEFILPLVTSLEKLNVERASLGVVKPELLDIEVKINSLEIFDRQQYFDMMGDFLEKGGKGRDACRNKVYFQVRGRGSLQRA